MIMDGEETCGGDLITRQKICSVSFSTFSLLHHLRYFPYCITLHHLI